ncbi:MAG: hypothetical protein Q4B29_02515 [Candidatus Saccharibacteria bacterium]|nr:hypothetical protein [Candidatus Saccharibacteria bacterium]
MSEKLGNGDAQGGGQETGWESLHNYAGIDEKTERINDKIDDYVSKGIISEEHAERMKAQREKAADIERTESDALEAKLSGGAEEYGARLRRMHELTEKFQAESRAELDEEEKEELEEEKRQREARKKQLEKELAELEDKPLVAINADFTHDKKELAHDLAEQDLNAEVAEAKGVKGIVKRLWKGTLFKKYFEKKYEKEYLAGDRERDGKTVHELIEEQSESAMKRFVLGATEDMRFIHSKAGETLEEADAETGEKVKAAIEKFATAKIPEGKTLEDLKLQFMEELGRSEAEAKDDGKNIDPKLINNYLEVAIQARQRAEHGIAIEKVMEGFKVYNAEARDGLRTEAHRDNIDKIVNKIESSRFGQFIPAEVVAGAAGVAFALTQTGARAVAGVAGGIVASGVVSGLKERNRITEDRARMLRDAANGLEYSGMDEEAMKDLKGRAKKTAKYEKRIGGTLYDLQPASELTANLEKAMAMEPGEERSKALMQAIAEARVRIDFSDSEQKDLISYSSADKRGDERLTLDRLLIQAEKTLPEGDTSKIESVKEHLQSEIEEGVDEKDEDFRKTRAWLALKKAGKTMAIGAASFVVSQEVIATIDPGKIGIFEKAGLLKTNNAADAKETLLASGFGFNRGMQITNVDQVKVSGDDQVTMEQLEQAGYQKTELSQGFSDIQTKRVQINPADSDSALKLKWGWANNGTKAYDGNELRIFNGDNGSLVSGMKGISTMGSETFDYAALADQGKITGIMNIGGESFEIASRVDSAGKLVFGENGVFTTTSGETIKAIGSNGEKLYKFFSVVVDQGDPNADGIRDVISLATDVGSNSFSGTMEKVVETVVEHPGEYLFTKATETVRNITAAGGIIVPDARTGLGRAGVREPEGDVDIMNIDRTDGPEMIVGGERITSTKSNEGNETPPPIANEFGSSETSGASTRASEALNAFRNLDNAQRAEAVQTAFSNMGPEVQQSFLESLFAALLGGDQGQAAA